MQNTENSTVSEIGNNIRTIRKQRKLTIRQLQSEIYRLTGHEYSENMLSMWELGQRRMYADQLEDLCIALECTPNHIYPKYHNKLDSSILELYLSLPASERAIIKYCASGWKGNSRALVYFMGLYMGMDVHYRKDLAEYGIWKYENAVKDGHLEKGAPPVAYDYIVEQAKKIGK